MNSKHRWAICCLYAFVVLGLSLIPSPALEDTPKLFPHQDKVIHALMYGILAGLLFWAFQVPARRNPRAWIMGIIVIATIYGALMEVLQGVLVWVNRDCSWGDMLANLGGAILAVGFLALHRRFHERAAGCPAPPACNAVRSTAGRWCGEECVRARVGRGVPAEPPPPSGSA